MPKKKTPVTLKELQELASGMNAVLDPPIDLEQGYESLLKDITEESSEVNPEDSIAWKTLWRLGLAKEQCEIKKKMILAKRAKK